MSASPLPGLPAPALEASVVTLGNFDGLHVGHRRIVDVLRAEAALAETLAVVLTLEPHPNRVLRPETPFQLLVPVERRVTMLRDAGVDHVAVLPFDREMAGLEPEEFVARYVLEPLRPRVFVAGPDTRFGRERAGDAGLLAEIGAREGFRVVEVGAVEVEGHRISSSTIRERLRAGDVRTAARWLGRPFAVEGIVARGAGRGRGIGVPTANVETEWETVPALGVYAARVRVADAAGWSVVHPAAVNLGVRPTFGDLERPLIEAHLLDGTDHDLYGRALEVTFVDRIRGERRFDSVDALVERIRADVTEARACLAGGEP